MYAEYIFDRTNYESNKLTEKEKQKRNKDLSNTQKPNFCAKTSIQCALHYSPHFK
jgi:hypothetical protein